MNKCGKLIQYRPRTLENTEGAEHNNRPRLRKVKILNTKDKRKIMALKGIGRNYDFRLALSKLYLVSINSNQNSFTF